MCLFIVCSKQLWYKQTSCHTHMIYMHNAGREMVLQLLTKYEAHQYYPSSCQLKRMTPLQLASLLQQLLERGGGERERKRESKGGYRERKTLHNSHKYLQSLDMHMAQWLQIHKETSTELTHTHTHKAELASQVGRQLTGAASDAALRSGTASSPCPCVVVDRQKDGGTRRQTHLYTQLQCNRHNHSVLSCTTII